MDFIDLKTQQRAIRSEIEKRINQVLNHGQYILGPEVRELEEKLARYVNASYAIGVASGTDALLMPLLAKGIGPGDAVFTSPFTFIATAEVIQLLGATPVFIDINPNTFNIDPAQLEMAIKAVINNDPSTYPLPKPRPLKARGIIPVDLFGQPAEYEEINRIAGKYGLFVIEDAAQSFGGAYKGKKCCSLAEVSATSFFPAKPLGCYGDGGMIFTNNKELYDHLISIRVHGMGLHNKYENIRVGINGRLDTIQAAILLAKMEIFDDEIEKRQQVARRYSQELKSTVQTPYIKEYCLSSWAQYSVLHPDRNKVLGRLKEQGIPTAIYYPIPLHRQKAFTHLGYNQGDFPISEEIAQKIFSLPFHPYLEAKAQEKIIHTILG